VKTVPKKPSAGATGKNPTDNRKTLKNELGTGLKVEEMSARSAGSRARKLKEKKQERFQ